MKLFVDYDDTIMASSERAIKWFNDLGYQPNTDIKSIDFEHNIMVYSNQILPWYYTQWFKDLTQDTVMCMIEDREYTFSTNQIDNAFSVLYRLSKKMDIYIVTVGTNQNLINKLDFLQENFKFVKGVIASTDFNKGLIDMTDSIFIDDRSDFLGRSNAKNKILFKYKGINRETNQNWDGPVAYNWTEIEGYIRNYPYYIPRSHNYLGSYGI